jgi:hypothetical protein
MKAEITKTELLNILTQGFDNIPNDVELEVLKDGKVYLYCIGFQQPTWLDGIHYMNSDATIEIYDLGNDNGAGETIEWEYNSEK